MNMGKKSKKVKKEIETKPIDKKVVDKKPVKKKPVVKKSAEKDVKKKAIKYPKFQSQSVSRNSNIKVIAASVFISMMLTTGGAFLILPLMFPGINGDLQTHLQSEPRIIQTKYLQIEPDSAEIHDYTTAWTKIAEDLMNISIGNNSQILVEYSTHYILGISNLDPFTRVGFEVQIRIEGVSSETQRIGHYSSDGYTSQVEFEGTLNMDLLTSNLPAGEYSIVMYWRSEQSNAGSQYLIFSNTNVQYNRTLYVHEVVNYGM
jgi:hypothetical protein